MEEREIDPMRQRSLQETRGAQMGGLKNLPWMSERHRGWAEALA